MRRETFPLFAKQLKNVCANSPFYKKKFDTVGLNPEDIKSIDDIAKIPFTDKNELRLAYPLGLQSVPEEQVVRIHSSSGTTGDPVIIPYTANDVAHWAEMFARCYTLAGVTNTDRIHITPGYGLWTAGIGFQAGAELLGAMAVPMGPGNTEKQMKMMVDLKTTVLCSTSSYALVLSEIVEERKLQDKIHLKKGIIGSERWGDKMRNRIKSGLNIELFDIYGLTEIYGPGISIDCPAHEGLHYFDDFLYFEVIDPKTLEVLPYGQQGELVITTLKKEGAPLIRYRTHDLTVLYPNKCSCGSEFPMHGRIFGRTDDMIKVKGVNIFPGQIDEMLKNMPGASSEYAIYIDHVDNHDKMTLKFEAENGCNLDDLANHCAHVFKTKIGIKIDVEVLPMGVLPRSEKKTQRVFDYRQ